MKIDRLIGILSVLLRQEVTTAPKLAEIFEVSRRTINRDIEDLCRSRDSHTDNSGDWRRDPHSWKAMLWTGRSLPQRICR